MTDPAPYMVNVALIESRAAELGWDSATFVAELGLHPRDLGRLLRPDRVTLAWLAEIADALGLHPADLITAGDTGSASRQADAEIVEAVLMPRHRPAPVSAETLSVLLGWPVSRVEVAVDALAQRLQDTAVRMLREQGGYVIASRPPGAWACDELPGMRRQANPLTVDDVAQVLANLSAATAGLTCEHLSSPLPVAERLLPGRLASESDAAPDRFDHVSVHPDLLFALLLVDEPARLKHEDGRHDEDRL